MKSNSAFDFFEHGELQSGRKQENKSHKQEKLKQQLKPVSTESTESIHSYN